MPFDVDPSVVQDATAPPAPPQPTSWQTGFSEEAEVERRGEDAELCVQAIHCCCRLARLLQSEENQSVNEPGSHDHTFHLGRSFSTDQLFSASDKIRRTDTSDFREADRKWVHTFHPQSSGHVTIHRCVVIVTASGVLRQGWQSSGAELLEVPLWHLKMPLKRLFKAGLRPP